MATPLLANNLLDIAIITGEWSGHPVLSSSHRFQARRACDLALAAANQESPAAQTLTMLQAMVCGLCRELELVRCQTCPYSFTGALPGSTVALPEPSFQPDFTRSPSPC